MTLKRIDSLHEGHQILRVFAGGSRVEQGSAAAEGMWIKKWRAPL